MQASPEKVKFFDTMAEQGLALSFDDVRLRTDACTFDPNEIVTSSHFSTNVELRVPIVSAAMDTVTTAEMAIAVAKLGGIGVIHAGLDIKDQKEEVRRVKLHLNGLIEKPRPAYLDESLEEVLNRCRQNHFDFRTFPVLDREGHFKGLLTQNDFDFCDDVTKKVCDVMTPAESVVFAAADLTVSGAYQLMLKNKKKTIPLIDENGKLTGLYVFSDVARRMRDNPERHNLDPAGRLRVAAAVPTSLEAVERVEAMRQYVDVVVVDTAQGDSKYAVDTLKELKRQFPELDVVVGNISEGSSAKMLVAAGANGIKVGQGPGSICTTRIETGIGCPQVTAVYECAKAIQGSEIPVCADGGIRNLGDFAIAIAAGADSAMFGNMLAGTKEAPGEVITLENSMMVKIYRGMGSPAALRESAAARRRYGNDDRGLPLAEGIEATVPYKGEVSAVVLHLVQALRKAMTYTGKPTIAALRDTGLFRRITASGMRESQPHDVMTTSRSV